MKLRNETFKQLSGSINLNKVDHLKERNYKVIPVTLDGDAPKQYIKAYFYFKNCPRKSNPNSWEGYYAKFGSKSYPHESIVEFAINQIGEALGLKMNETRLVYANGQVRFLSKDFIKKGKRLIHGTEILAEYFEDKNFVDQINKDRKSRREFFTFDEVENAISHVYEDQAETIVSSLVQLITFDGIVGNNDRHFYNWGVIGDTRRDFERPVEFAPVYDSARGLLWNLTNKEVLRLYKQSLTDPSFIEGYCNKSKPRFSFSNNTNANHFELLAHLAKNPSYRRVIADLVSVEKEQLSLSKLSSTVSSLFMMERMSLMLKVLKHRFQKIRRQL